MGRTIPVSGAEADRPRTLVGSRFPPLSSTYVESLFTRCTREKRISENVSDGFVVRPVPQRRLNGTPGGASGDLAFEPGKALPETNLPGGLLPFLLKDPR